MKHRIAGRKLSRSRQQRKALFKSLISSLIHHDSIETTESKAKAIKPIVDKLVTKAKKPNLSSHRQVQAFLQDKLAAVKLVKTLAPSFKRTSGFTRLVRTIIRRGDSTQMARLEWVDQPEPEKTKKPSPNQSKPKSRVPLKSRAQIKSNNARSRKAGQKNLKKKK